MFKLDIEGIDIVSKNLEGKLVEVKLVLKDEIYHMGQHLRSESVKQCPVDTGRLRASATVTPVKEEGDTFYVEVGYGTDYAIYVHERTELRHKVGKAKFLEDPLKENANNYKEWIRSAIRRVIG